jgi:hypothetical protein
MPESQQRQACIDAITPITSTNTHLSKSFKKGSIDKVTRDSIAADDGDRRYFSPRKVKRYLAQGYNFPDYDRAIPKDEIDVATVEKRKACAELWTTLVGRGVRLI